MTALQGVAKFYRRNHERQTVAYVRSKEDQDFALTKAKGLSGEAAEFLNTLEECTRPSGLS